MRHLRSAAGFPPDLVKDADAMYSLREGTKSPRTPSLLFTQIGSVRALRRRCHE
jgi:hypothetical protein